MAKAMSYPEVFRILIDGGYVASAYHAQKAAEHTVHGPGGRRQGHLTGLQMEELLKAGVLQYDKQTQPEKGAEFIQFFRMRKASEVE